MYKSMFVTFLILFSLVTTHLWIKRFTVGIDMTDIRFVIENKWEYLIDIIFLILSFVFKLLGDIRR